MQDKMPSVDFSQADRATKEDDTITLFDLARPLIERWRVLAAGTVCAAGAGFLIATMLPKWYSASVVMLPPQQQQSSAAAAAAQLGALAGLAGSFAGLKSPVDQYIALMQSTSVSDRIVDQFKLMDVYELELRVDARTRLSKNVRITAGKKDGLIAVEVDDRDPQRAADIANAYVENLRYLTTRLAVTEAQQRRAFFEQQMKDAHARLTKAQIALGNVGVGGTTLKIEPRSAVESYARLRAEATGAEVRLQTLRRSLTDNAPEVKQQEGLLAALKAQISRSEAQESSGSGGSEYITKYRDFKYEEALFDIFAKQYELARVDESREGAIIQVVDAATAPERRAGPRRLIIATISALLTLTMLAIWLVGRYLAQRERRSETH